MSLLDMALMVVIAGAVALAVARLVKNRRAGCSGCCAECDRACAARKGDK